MSTDRFTNSCAIIEYTCPEETKYIDPCDCHSYLWCIRPFEISRVKCPTGTAWDHELENCEDEKRVLIGGGKLCERDYPWNRCNTVDDHQSIETLQDICNGLAPPGNGGSGGSSSDAAGIVGGVLGVALLIIIIAIIVYFVKRKKRRSDSTTSQAYKADTKDDRNSNAEEVYDIINEKAVSPSESFNNAAYDKDAQDKTQGNLYHNAADGGDGARGGHIDTGTYSPLEREKYDDVKKSYSTIRDSQPENLSRTISVGGKEITVQDHDGYLMGFPSGSVPRQPSPLPDIPTEDEDGGYSLGVVGQENQPDGSEGKTPDYFVLQKSDNSK